MNRPGKLSSIPYVAACTLPAKSMASATRTVNEDMNFMYDENAENWEDERKENKGSGWLWSTQ